MKILLISKTGDGLGVLYKFYKDGHDTKAFIRNANCRKKLKNVISKVNTINEGLEWNPDLVVFDSFGLGKFGDKIKSEGKKIFGASLLADKLLFDKEFASKKYEQCGLKFGKDGEEITIGRTYEDGKPSGTDYCFVTTNTFYPCDLGKKIKGMSTVAWVNDNESLSTECDKLDAYVEKHRYSGVCYFVLGVGKEIQVREIIPQFSLHYSNLHFELLKFKEAFGCSLRITIPPYPLCDDKYGDFVYMSTDGIPIEGIDKNFYPNDVCFDNGWKTAGTDGIVGDIVVLGKNTNDVFGRIGKIFSDFNLDEMTARVDFMDYHNQKLKALISLGFNLDKYMGGVVGINLPGSDEKDLLTMYKQAIKKQDNVQIRNIIGALREKGKSLTDLVGLI